MFNQPYGGWPPQYPSQPVVFIPPHTPSDNPLDTIRQWKLSIEELEKAFKKEDKKDDKKDDKKKQELSVPSLMLLMILLSPITGPIMSRFFQWGLASLPH